MKYPICVTSFVFLFIFSLSFFDWGISLLIFDISLLIEWEIVSINSSSIVMTVLLDWMSLIFMTFMLYISSMVICYSGQYMSTNNFYINSLSFLVLMFVSSMMLLIISPNIISMGRTWFSVLLFSYLLSEYTIL